MRAETMKCVVRIARKQDVCAIAALDRLANTNYDTEKTWKLRISHKQEAIVLVACRHDTREVIGYLFGLIVGSYKRLMDVNVIETHRRAKIGSNLLQVMIASPGGIAVDAIIPAEDGEVAADFLRHNDFEVCRHFMFVPEVVRYVWRPDKSRDL